jgi:glycosyltransferase involved in cell wall biosynthesis
MHPAVSIILPTFNRLEFLPAAIESVVVQTFTDWELIIADDGSGTETRTCLRALEDPPRVRVICLPHTGKPAAARNAALRAARGEYVAFLDSDDIWRATKLEIQIASLRSRPTREWGCTRFEMVDAAGRPTRATRAEGWPAPSGWIFEDLANAKAVIALPSVIARRDLVERVGGFDEELVMCEDDDLWLRLAEQSEIDGIETPLTLVRRHDRHCGNAIAAYRDRRRVIDKVLQSCNRSDLSALLCRQRAAVSVELAKSYAAYGDPIGAVRTILSSAPRSWRYPRWWIGVTEAVGRTCVPGFVRRAVRSYWRTLVRSEANAAR